MEIALALPTTPSPLKTCAPEDGFAVHRDEGPWMTAEPGVAYQYMFFDLRKNAYAMLARVAPGAALPPRYRTEPALLRVIEGRGAYRERGWTPTVGSTVYEAAGEVHTLVNAGTEPLVAFIHVTGPSIIVDGDGRQIRYEDVHSVRAAALAACRARGVAADLIERITR